MARPKKKKKNVSRGDAEALALVLFGFFLFLAASLYPAKPLSGELGQAVNRALKTGLGAAAYLLPIPLGLSPYWILARKPLGGLIWVSGLAFIAALLALPLLSPLDPGLGGEVGRVAYEALVRALGPVGLALPALGILLTYDLARRRRPLETLVRVGRALGALWRTYRNYRQKKAERKRLKRQSVALLREATSLLERYPEHTSLQTLVADLKQLLKKPDAEALEAWRTLLDTFRDERVYELRIRLKEEPLPLLEAIEQDLKALREASARAHPRLRPLEERRRALILEFKALLARARNLNRELEGALSRLEGDGFSLEAELEAHEARKKAWQALAEELEDLKTRAERFELWRAWLLEAPEAAVAAGLRILSAQGLRALPPKISQAEDEAGLEIELPDPAPKAEPDTRPPKSEPKAPPPPTPIPLSRELAPPPPELFDPPTSTQVDRGALEAEAAERAEVINKTLTQFGLKARVVNWARGPAVTRYELEPAPGEKIARIASLANDIARALAVGSVRIEAPIPGKSVIGLEVPNRDRELVRFSEALHNSSYQRSRALLPLILGKSIEGEYWVKDLAKMPHLLIAGSTGSGKSVSVNTLVMSLLCKYLPTELRLLMIDPKMVELTPYDGIPHLVRGVVTNPADAAGVLLGAVAHMERRYKMMSQVGARNLQQFNRKMREAGEPTLPYLIIVIDELADLMITSPKEVEQAILRLAQMARATGMHLILATQRPSVDILTSLIKVNIPARIAFAVSSSHDSRTILDSTGAERLTGQGDMLFYQPGLPKPVRLQGPYLSDQEIHRVAAFLRQQEFEDVFVEKYGSDFDGPPLFGEHEAKTPGQLDFSDPLLEAAARIVVEEGQGSVSRLQRRLSIGHARAGKLMDLLEAMGIVGPHQGSKPREVLIGPDELPEYFGKAQ